MSLSGIAVSNTGLRIRSKGPFACVHVHEKKGKKEFFFHHTLQNMFPSFTAAGFSQLVFLSPTLSFFHSSLLSEHRDALPEMLHFKQRMIHYLFLSSLYVY